LGWFSPLQLCSNRAATRVNLLKRWEKRNKPNTSICGYFASLGKAQQSIVPDRKERPQTPCTLPKASQGEGDLGDFKHT
jgi:hypothetical protein